MDNVQIILAGYVVSTIANAAACALYVPVFKQHFEEKGYEIVKKSKEEERIERLRGTALMLAPGYNTFNLAVLTFASTEYLKKITFDSALKKGRIRKIDESQPVDTYGIPRTLGTNSHVL